MLQRSDVQSIFWLSGRRAGAEFPISSLGRADGDDDHACRNSQLNVRELGVTSAVVVWFFPFSSFLPQVESVERYAIYRGQQKTLRVEGSGEQFDVFDSVWEKAKNKLIKNTLASSEKCVSGPESVCVIEESGLCWRLKVGGK